MSLRSKYHDRELLALRSPLSNCIINCMSKFTTASAVICIWLVTFVSIASISKIAGVPLPRIGQMPSWDWLKLVIELCGLFFG